MKHTAAEAQLRKMPSLQLKTEENSLKSTKTASIDKDSQLDRKHPLRTWRKTSLERKDN